MTDFYELDFLDVESERSGDAIAIRYRENDRTTIHITDGGYQDTGTKLVGHIRKYYGNPTAIDHVVVTHPDGDHAGGLRVVLDSFEIRELWMLRPWLYVNELLPRFARFTSADNLRTRLRAIYGNIAALEDIAMERRIAIRDPFQGSRIGAFTVLAPSRQRYLDLIVQSERTPESMSESPSREAIIYSLLEAARSRVTSVMRAAWGLETFSSNDTSAENEMSVIQFGILSGKKILLTADTGRAGLAEAAAYAPMVGLSLPGMWLFQVPHHGSRRNVSTATLDRWLGPRLTQKPVAGGEQFTAVISSAKADEDHPRKAVVRAMIHRGGRVLTTEGRSILFGENAPSRGWSPVAPEPYPEEQEE